MGCVGDDAMLMEMLLLGVWRLVCCRLKTMLLLVDLILGTILFEECMGVRYRCVATHGDLSVSELFHVSYYYYSCWGKCLPNIF